MKKEILDNFDFESVHRVMEFIHFAQKIPSIKEMKKHTSKLIDNALKGLKKSGLNEYIVISGGFEACAFYGEEGAEVALRFIGLQLFWRKKTLTF